MKPFHLLFLLLSFTVLHIQAQRRTTSTSTEHTKAASSRSPARSRGRSRFTLTQEFKENAELSSTIQPTFKHISPRKRVSDFADSRESRSKPQIVKSNYEVQEIVNESPIDSFKRQSKPRVLTENVFEASSTSKQTSSEEITSTSESTKIKQASDSDALLTELSTEETYTASNSDNIETPSAEFSESQEISRTQPLSTTPKTTQEPAKSSRRSNGRRGSASEEVTTFASRARTRSRANEATTASRNTRAPRRRAESSTLVADASRRGPSVFDAPQAEVRSRPGRRIDTASTERSSGRASVVSTERTRSKSGKRLETLRPEKISLDIPKEQPSRSKTFPSRSSGGQRRNSETTTASTVSSRGGRFRTRTTTPVIDEQKLEVLPLFESEPKTVQPPSRGRSRTKERRDSENEVVTVKPSRRSGRTRNLKSETEDPMQASSTETDIQFQTPEVSSQVSVETKKEPATGRRSPKVKESVVISAVSEVTSKKVVTRRKNTAINEVGEKVNIIGKIVPRGKKRSEVKLSEAKRKNDDSEEVDDSDNYPEPFKALIQAKKSKKESRPSTTTSTSSPSEHLRGASPAPSPHPTSAPVVVTSIVTSSSSASAEVTKEYPDLDNELVPRITPTTFKPTIRPIRNRFSLTTKIPNTTPGDADKQTKSPSRKWQRTRTTTQAPSSSSFSSRESRGPTTYAPRASTTAAHSSRDSRFSTTATPRVASSSWTPSRGESRFSSSTPAVVRVYPTPSLSIKESSSTDPVVKISSTTAYIDRESRTSSTTTSSPVFSTGRNSKSQSLSSKENKISSPTSFPSRQSSSYFPNRDTTYPTIFSTSEFYEPSVPSTTAFSSREASGFSHRGAKLFTPNSFNSENGPLVSTFAGRETVSPGRGTKLLTDTLPIKPSRNTSRERFSGRKKGDRGSRERFNKSVEEPILLSTKIPKSAFVPKKPSDRYRGDLSLRTAVTRTTTNAPVYIPTIPSAPYVPTVPTVTPPTRSAWKPTTEYDDVWNQDIIDNWSFPRLYWRLPSARPLYHYLPLQ